MTVEHRGQEISDNPAVLALEATFKARNSENLPGESRRRLAVHMARTLGHYVEGLEMRLLPGDLRRTMQYFVADSANGITPVERMASIYESLAPVSDKQSDISRHTLAISEHSTLLVARAFDQHHENPEKYVSHGFDHSIRVADYALDILNQPGSRILKSTASKYGITEGETVFIFQLISFYHDMGYPLLAGRPKAFHGIPAADMINRSNMKGLNTLLLSSMANKHSTQLETLLDDMRDAVLYHGADKIEGEFVAQIRTSGGKLLFKNPGDISAAVSQLCYLQDGGLPFRDVALVNARNADVATRIAAAFNPEYLKQRRQRPVFPIIGVAPGSAFRGRSVSLGFSEEAHLGIEYQIAETSSSPFIAVLRLADNMDAAGDRLSNIQRDPAFQEIYLAFGDNGPVSLRLQELESKEKSGDEVDSRAVVAWKKLIVESILEKSEHAARIKEKPELADKIRDIASGQNSGSLPHFGGCQAIKSVRMEGTAVVVTVDKAKYEKLNTIEVDEKSLDPEGRTRQVKVKVGDYQIWRMQEAFQTIKINGNDVEVKIT